MKRFFYIIVVLICMTSFGYAQTIIGGVIFTDTTLRLANSPYHVTSDILVPIGVSLKIEPGVVMLFDYNVYCQIEGELQAIGTPSDSIIFKGSSVSSAWGGFKFSNTAISYNQNNGSGCIFDYCVISYTENDAIRIDGSGVAILHSEIKNCGSGIIAYGSGILIQHSKIHDCYSAISTYYPPSFALPVTIDQCEIYNINGSSDLIRLTGNASLTNSNIHNCTSPISALSVWSGPSTFVACNNFHHNSSIAILIIGSPNNTVQISNNSFDENKVNLQTTSCYKTPIITNNNFYSYLNYNIYCTDQFLLIDNDCQPINNGSYFTLDLTQNYFASTSAKQLDSSIYDFYDNWIGRTIVAYDTSIVTPFTNNSKCSIISTLVETKTDQINFLSLFPNPTEGHFRIEISKTIKPKFRLSIYNTVGLKVYDKYYYESSEVDIDLSDMHSGFYNVVVETETIKLTKKLCLF